MTQGKATLFLLQGKLLIKALCGAQLWQRTLLGPNGRSIRLSPHLTTIATHLLLRPGLKITDFIPILWPNPDHEPEFSGNCLRQKFWKLGQALAYVGLQVNPWKGGHHHEGKWIERVPGPGQNPGPSLTINTTPPPEP